MSTSRARRAVPVVVVRSDMIDEHKATVVEAVRDLMRVVQSPDAAIALTAELRIPVLHGSDGSSKGAAGRGRGKLEQHNPLLAAVLKQRLDASLGVGWNVIMGRNLQVQVRYMKSSFCHLRCGDDLLLLAFKCASDSVVHHSSVQDAGRADDAARGAKHVSVFSTRMDDETAALVQRLVGEARVACGSDVPKFLTAVKATLTQHLGASWSVVHGELGPGFAAATACDELVLPAADSADTGAGSGSQPLGNGADGSDGSGAGGDGGGEVRGMEMQMRVGKHGKLVVWRETRVRSAMPLATGTQIRTVVYFVALTLLVGWYYARQRCDWDCMYPETMLPTCTDDMVAAAGSCRSRVNYLVYAAVAVFMLSPAMRMGRRMFGSMSGTGKGARRQRPSAMAAAAATAAGMVTPSQQQSEASSGSVE